MGSTHFYLDSAAPLAPALTDPPTAVGQDSVSLNWTAPAGCVPTGYKIYRNSTLITSMPLSASTTGYLDSGLSAGTIYSYQVAAYNGAGSTPSNQVMVTTTTAPTPAPNPVPTASPTPAPTDTPTPVATVSPTPGLPTPTATYNTGSSSSLISAPSTPTPVPVSAQSTPLTAADRILRGLLVTGTIFVLAGIGLLLFWKRRTAKLAPQISGEKKTLAPEVEPDTLEK